MEVTPSRLGIFFTWVIVFNAGTTDQNIIYGCIATLIFIFMPKLFRILIQKINISGKINEENKNFLSLLGV